MSSKVVWSSETLLNGGGRDLLPARPSGSAVWMLWSRQGSEQVQNEALLIHTTPRGFGLRNQHITIHTSGLLRVKVLAEQAEDLQSS